MSKILTEISSGELLDKISILEIKLDKIKDPPLFNKVKKEYGILTETKSKNIKYSKEIDVIYKELKQVNEKLWNIEDDIRLCEKNTDFKDKFIQLAREVYLNNDKRSVLKSKINKLLGSDIEEVKQYTKY